MEYSEDLCECGKVKSRTSIRCKECDKKFKATHRTPKRNIAPKTYADARGLNFRAIFEGVKHNCIGVTDGHRIFIAGKVGDVS